MAICPRCGSRDVSVQLIQTGAKTKKYGNGFGGHIHNVDRAVLGIATLGASNLFIKKRKGIEKTKMKTERVFICQNCGHTFDHESPLANLVYGNSNPVQQPTQSVEPVGNIAGNDEYSTGSPYSIYDPVVRKAVEVTIKKGKFSTAYLQTRLGKGNAFVSGLGVWLADMGVIESLDGSNRPRKVLIQTMEEFLALANPNRSEPK